MTIFKSRQVNLDPEPWVAWGVRYPKKAGSAYYDPRPEFEPTRDLYPWSSADGPARYGSAPYPHATWFWNPRRDEFDTPVNPILAAFRGRLDYQRAVNPVSTSRLAEVWLSNVPRYGGVPGATPEQIDHAHRVLTRLAALA